MIDENSEIDAVTLKIPPFWTDSRPARNFLGVFILVFLFTKKKKIIIQYSGPRVGQIVTLSKIGSVITIKLLRFDRK